MPIERFSTDANLTIPSREIMSVRRGNFASPDRWVGSGQEAVQAAEN